MLAALRALRSLNTAVIGLVAVLVSAFLTADENCGSDWCLQIAGVMTEDEPAFAAYSYEDGNEAACRPDSRLPLGLGPARHVRSADSESNRHREFGSIEPNSRPLESARPQRGWVALRL